MRYVFLLILGCFLAGGAGVIGAYLFGVTLELGMSILLLAVVVVVVGGTGSVHLPHAQQT